MAIPGLIGISRHRLRRFLFTPAVLAMLAAATFSVDHGDAHAGSPQKNTFAVRGNMCGNNGWNPFDTQDKANDISVWCYSKAAIKKLGSSLYQSITENTVCQLRCAVRAKFSGGQINTDPWPSHHGCASFVSKILAVKGKIVYAGGSSDGSATGNHCHITGPTLGQLQNAFANHYDCTGYVGQ